MARVNRATLNKEKPLDRTEPAVPRADGFRSEADARWYMRHFETRPLMVERQLDITYTTDEEPWFLTRLRHYSGWIDFLTIYKECNADWVRELTASLIRDPGQPHCFIGYLRGAPVEITPRIVSDLIHVRLVPNHFYPARAATAATDPSLDEMVTEITGGRRRKWNTQDKPQKMDLTDDYRMLFLAICNCIDPTAYTAELSADRVRFVYAVGTGRPVCLSSVYLSIIHDAGYQSAENHLKSAYVLHLIAASGGRQDRDTDVIETSSHATPFGMASEARSRGQKRDRDVAGTSRARGRARARRAVVDDDSDDDDAEMEAPAAATRTAPTEGPSRTPVSAARRGQRQRRDQSAPLPDDIPAQLAQQQALLRSIQAELAQQQLESRAMQTQIGQLGEMLGAIISHLGIQFPPRASTSEPPPSSAAPAQDPSSSSPPAAPQAPTQEEEEEDPDITAILDYVPSPVRIDASDYRPPE